MTHRRRQVATGGGTNGEKGARGECGEREPITGIWRRTTQRGPTVVPGHRSTAPEAESFSLHK